MEVVRERQSLEAARERVYIEWQTKVLAAFIARTVQSEKGASAMLKEAAGLSLFKPPPSPTPPDVVAGSTGPLTEASARPGSYERLVAGFGARGAR